MGDEIIRLENVTKKYRNKKILENVNLSVEKGSSIALLGNNGTGKSTLLKIICKLSNYSSGSIVYGKDIKFNYIPEHFSKLNITAEQYIEHMGLIENIPIQKLRSMYNEYFEKFGMTGMIDTPLKHLSKGTLQKVAVIQAFLRKPDVLLLDEPLSGQDFQSQKYFIELINELKNQGVSILMSCHEMFLVNQISDIVYRISNRQLERINIEDIVNEEYDILSFENNKKTKIEDKILENVEKIDYSQEQIRLIIRSEKSNDVLIDMLKEGYKLRAMRGNEK